MIIDGNALSGSDYSGRRYMRLLGHLPMLLCDDPEKVLVICLGTGMTLGACSRHEETKKLFCVEISPEVVRAARQFTRVNYAVLDQSRARVLTGDGRNFLLSYPGSLDVITLEPPPPRARGVVNLYSREFYELCHKKLSEKGVMAQWIPLHDQSEEDVKALIKTFTSVFDNTTAWLIERHDLCLIGTVNPLSIELEDLRTRISAVKESLEDIDITNEWELLSMFLADRQGLDNYCGEVPVITDDLPLIEHFLSLPWNQSIISTPGKAGTATSFLEHLLLYRTPMVSLVKDGLDEEESFLYLRHRLAMDHFLDGVIYSDRGLPARGLQETRIARRLLTASGYFRHYLGISAAQRGELEDLIINGRGDTRQILPRYGYLEFEEGQYEKAREIFEKIVSIYPGEAEGYLHLAMTYEELGDLISARLAYERAVQLDTEGKEALAGRIGILDARRKATLSGELSDLDDLSVLYWKNERYEAAAEIFAEMVRVAPRSELARYNLASALEALGYYFDALDEYEAALKLDPGVEETVNNVMKLKVLLALKSESPREVVFPDGSQVRVDPGDAASYATLGKLYARNDEYVKAARFLKRALALRPDYAEALSMLEMIEGFIADELKGRGK
jgi:spermidine synthase/tetratricopeptide (TPR) repeat protein